MITINFQGGKENEVVRFEREMVELSGIQSGHEDPSQVNLEAMLQAINVDEAQLPDGSYVSTSTVSLPNLMGSMAQEIDRLRKQATELHRATRTDSKTGLPNYDAFVETLETYISQARRTHQSLDDTARETFTLVFFDVNDFRDYNKEHGHAAADVMLGNLADVFKPYGRRKSDGIFRFAGDEFAMILWETDKQTADVIACSMAEQAYAELGMRVSYGLANYAADVDDQDFTKPLENIRNDLVNAASTHMQKQKRAYKAFATSDIKTDDYQVAA